MPSIAHATKRPSLCESPTRLASALGQSPPSIAAAHWLCGKGNAATRGAKMERRRTTARTAQRPASAVTPPHTGLPYLHNRPSPPTAADVSAALGCSASSVGATVAEHSAGAQSTPRAANRTTPSGSAPPPAIDRHRNRPRRNQPPPPIDRNLPTGMDANTIDCGQSTGSWQSAASCPSRLRRLRRQSPSNHSQVALSSLCGLQRVAPKAPRHVWLSLGM